jgi:TRAP-type C4-dicarboxylate transport system permease small subunit
LQLIPTISKLLGAAANALLCVMVLVTCIDVVGRYFFDAPLLGAHEIITLAMGIMIYLGMPLVTASGEHLVVDLASSLLGPKAKRIQQIIVNAIAALTFILFSYLLLFHGIGLAEDLMVTEDFEIEQAPIAYLMAAMCFLTILVFLNQVFRGFTGSSQQERH